MTTISRWGGVGATLLLAGCGPQPQVVATGRVDAVSYYCEGGHTFQLDLHGDHAILTLAGKQWRLTRQPEAAGSRYSDGDHAVQTEGRSTEVSEGGQALYRGCTPSH